MLDKWGFDIDDPIIGRNKISAEVEYAGIDFEITLEKDGKSWQKDLDLLSLEVDARGVNLEILWEFIFGGWQLILRFHYWNCIMLSV